MESQRKVKPRAFPCVLLMNHGVVLYRSAQLLASQQNIAYEFAASQNTDFRPPCLAHRPPGTRATGLRCSCLQPARSSSPQEILCTDVSLRQLGSLAAAWSRTVVANGKRVSSCEKLEIHRGSSRVAERRGADRSAVQTGEGRHKLAAILAEAAAR